LCSTVTSPLGQQGGGFRTRRRKLHGSDDRLDQKGLQKMTGRFSRRLHGWAKNKAVPIIYFEAGSHKNKLAQTCSTLTLTREMFIDIMAYRQS